VPGPGGGDGLAWKKNSFCSGALLRDLLAMKTCSRCKADLPLESFYIYNGKPHCYCKPCVSDYSSQWAINNRLAKRASNKRWKSKNRERLRLSTQAHLAVWLALKDGKLVRPATCEKCGSQSTIQAAHTDYTQPLSVLWLCLSCHRTWDMAEPKTLAPAQLQSVHAPQG